MLRRDVDVGRHPMSLGSLTKATRTYKMVYKEFVPEQNS